MATKKTAKKKKTAIKKTAAKKTAAKKTAAKKTTAKKTTAKKTTAKKTTAKKAATKKAPTKKTATEPITPPAATTPEVGAPAPAFSLPGHDGHTHSLEGYRGRAVVLYFYPKDDTPGCTVEACDFRDNLARVQRKGAIVLGVSRDDLQSHERFAKKHGLDFPLLSDPDLVAHRAYGAWGRKVMYGKEVEGTLRSTFLIDGDGVLRASWPKVKVAGHVEEVLRALEAL